MKIKLHFHLTQYFKTTVNLIIKASLSMAHHAPLMTPYIFVLHYCNPNKVSSTHFLLESRLSDLMESQSQLKLFFLVPSEKSMPSLHICSNNIFHVTIKIFMSTKRHEFECNGTIFVAVAK